MRHGNEKKRTEKMLFTWRWAIISKNGPAPTTRHVLLTLSLHMDNSGGNGFPSTKKLADESGLSERTICTHLDKAVKDGWIKKTIGGVSGQGWKHHKYIPMIPPEALKEVQHLKAEGAERGSAASQKGTEPDAEGTEPSDKKALKEVQSNSRILTLQSNSTKYIFQKKVRVPPDFTLLPEMKAYAEKIKSKIDLDEFTENFILQCQAHGYKYKNWIAAWQTWLRKENGKGNQHNVDKRRLGGTTKTVGGDNAEAEPAGGKYTHLGKTLSN